MRPRDNNFTIDGADNKKKRGVRRQGFVALSPVPVESIAEMEVITALADARFGRNIGGQVLPYQVWASRYACRNLWMFTDSFGMRAISSITTIRMHRR